MYYMFVYVGIMCTSEPMVKTPTCTFSYVAVTIMFLCYVLKAYKSLSKYVLITLLNARPEPKGFLTKYSAIRQLSSLCTLDLITYTLINIFIAHRY